MPQVVLVGHEADEHSDHLDALLDARGVDHVRISSSQLPCADFAWAAGSNECRIGSVVVRRGAGAMWRRPGSPDVADYEAKYQRFAATESSEAFAGVLDGLELGWMARPDVLLRAERKPFQLAVAHSLGVPLPPTLVTNRAPDAISFAKAHGEVVVKPVRYGLVATDPPLVAWAQSMTAKDLVRLAGPPVIIQKRLRAARHLRVVTVAGECFVSELVTDVLDWRSDIENHNRFHATNAAASVRSSALSLAAALQIEYSAQDWIEAFDGETYFLEANPSGQWLFLDPVHDGRISSAIVDKLLELSRPSTNVPEGL